MPGGIGLDIGILAVATIYSFIIVAKGRIAVEDTIILGLLFLWYVIRLTKSPVEEPDLEGPAAAVGSLPLVRRRIVVTFLIAYSAAVIAMSAEPFVHGLEQVGRDVGIGEFFVIQWIAPLASESPEFLAALYLVWRSSAGMGVNMLISSKVNQWTLLIASVPIAYIAAGGAISGLISTDLQRAEVFITAAQSAFGVMLIIDRRLTARAGFALLGLFLAQLLTQFFFQDNNLPRIIFGIVYLALTALMLPSHWRTIPPTLREAFRLPRTTQTEPAPESSTRNDRLDRPLRISSRARSAWPTPPWASPSTTLPQELTASILPMPDPADDGRTGRVPAGCVFWTHAADRTFSTVAQDHANCSVGSVTHGFLKLTDVLENGDVGALLESGWVTPRSRDGHSGRRGEARGSGVRPARGSQ